MNRPLTLTLCCSIALLSIGGYRLLDSARELTLAQKGAAQAAIEKEGQATRDWAAAYFVPLVREAIERGDKRAASLQRDAKEELSGARSDVRAIAVGFQDSVMDTRADLLSKVDSIRSDLAPALGSIAAGAEELHNSVAELHTTLKDLHPQLLGLVAASKVTAGETAQTMRTARDSFPALVATVQDAAVHIDAAAAASAEASQNTAKLTANLAAATKPLPRGVRLGLQIAGPLSQIASYVILMLSTMGVL